MYYRQFDVYKNQQFVVRRVVRFKSKESADGIMAEWIRKFKDYKYQDIKEVNASEWMSGPNKINHFDCVNYK